jgi:L-arabinose transport system permease protein
VIFLLQGLVTGLAGIVLASRMTSGQPNSANGFELDVISACVLGGVSLSGGVGTISGIIIGVLIMGTVQNAMNLMNIPTFYQYVVRGSILLIAVLIDQMKQNSRRS